MPNIPPSQTNLEPQQKEKEIVELEGPVDEWGNPILPDEPSEEEKKIAQEETKVIEEPKNSK